MSQPPLNSKYDFDFDTIDNDEYLMIFSENISKVNHSIRLKLDEKGKKKLLEFCENGEDIEILSKDGIVVKMFTDYIEYRSEEGDIMKEVNENCDFYIEIGSKHTNYQMGYPFEFKLEIMNGIKTLLQEY